jgi:hypothetical protein
VKAANETARPDARPPVRPTARLPAGFVPLLSAIATVSVGAGLSAGYRGFDPVALAVVTAGALAAIAAAVLGSGRSPAASASGAVVNVERVLALALVAFMLSHVFVPPGLYAKPPQPLAFRVLAVAATLVALTYLWRPPPRIARWRFPALVALFVAMAVVVVQASPFPYIDVWWYQQYAGSLIWRGDNPYTFLYPNIYGPGGPFGPGVLEKGMVATFPYPPLTFLLGAPVVTYLEDVRYLLLGAAAAAALVAWRWCTSEAAELAILAFLLQPRAFFVVEQAWTEPLVMAGVAATVLALVRWRERGTGWIAAAFAGALLLSSKQYAPLIALPFVPAIPRGRRLATVAVAALLTAILLIPFIVWDPGEFFRDVALMQVNQPFRFDALSWLVPVARAVGHPVSATAGFIAAAVVLLLALRNDATPAHAARVSAAALLVFVLFNKQAFCNYYWLVMGLLAVSTSLELAARREDAA